MGEKRRGAGEGSIYRRKDGRWVGQYEVEGKRRYVYGQDREAIRTKLTKALADRDAGLVFDSRNLTVGEYAPLWLDSIRETVGPRTWKRHEELTRLHVIPRLGSAKLDKLNALQVQYLYRKKLDSGLSLTTVRKVHGTLYKALKQAVRWQLVPRNVCDSVTPPRATKVEIEALTKEQVKALLETARSDRLHALYVLACTTGMRQGEIQRSSGPRGLGGDQRLLEGHIGACFSELCVHNQRLLDHVERTRPVRPGMDRKGTERSFQTQPKQQLVLYGSPRLR